MSYLGNVAGPVKSVAGKVGEVELNNVDVGLDNVTNDAQLKIASNLSDLNDAAVARTNLGLGDAAVADILGAVSQSGGIPTGAVVERGSNANGEYVRFADGTQICTTKTALASQAPAQFETTGIYSFSIIVSSAFPAVFSDLPNILLSGRTQNGSFALASMGGTATSGQWPAERRVLSVGGFTTTAELVSVAIGRWF